MKLIIDYRDGGQDTISDFESVSFVSNGNRKVITNDFSGFNLSDRTYNFKGAYQLSLRGDIIKSIALLDN